VLISVCSDGNIGINRFVKASRFSDGFHDSELTQNYILFRPVSILNICILEGE